MKKITYNFTCMKLLKYLVLLTFLVSCETSFSQGGWTRPNNSYGIIQARGSFQNAILLPTGSGAPSTLDAYDLHQFALKGDSVGHQMYYYDPSLQTWSIVGTAGTSATIVDSVVIHADGLHPEITFTLTRTGFKDVHFYYEDARAAGFQQANTDTEGTLDWAASVTGDFKIYEVFNF
jgi:hypothetical protein